MKGPPPNIVASSQTLWIGDLEPHMDELFLSNVFTTLGLRSVIKSIKVIRDKQTNVSSGYGFVEFSTHDTAQNVLDSYNGTLMPGTKKAFHLKWGAFGSGTKPSNTAWNANQKTSIFVGDLEANVNDKQLLDFFKEKYPSAIFARIIYDPVTKYSKSYGFVEFTNPTEAQRAITETTGMFLAGRMIRVSSANLKTNDNPSSLPDIVSGDDPEAQQMALMQKQQLYQYYYSIMDDPIQKLQYQKQLEQLSKVDVMRGVKKKSIKNDLESIHSLEYSETRLSEPFLDDLPSTLSYKGKMAALRRIFN